MMAEPNADVIVLGAGHNGLVCANYLAAAGLRVTVLERREIVGGAAVTEEFVPGYRNSSASYTVSLLHPTVIRATSGGRKVRAAVSDSSDRRSFRIVSTLLSSCSLVAMIDTDRRSARGDA